MSVLYTELNDFQKKALAMIRSTTKNVIVSAPTGSGKTTLAIRLMLENEKRSLYLAPLKSLAYEVYRKIYAIDPKAVAYITGDEWMDLDRKYDEKIIVTTYEKGDSIIRHQYDWFKDFSLFIIDEIHNVSDRKALELVSIYAMLNNIRIVAMSATIPNVHELASWLNAEVFQYSKRSIPLYVYVKYKDLVCGPPKYRDLLETYDPIELALKKNKTVMIFAKSRRNCYAILDRLVQQFGPKIRDQVAIFHSGLSKAQRQKLIEEINQKKKSIVITTTALGQGINLPIWMVVFYDTFLPLNDRGVFMGWRWLTKNEFDQIAGRAGRPGFDEDGVVVIMAKDMVDFEQKKMIYVKGRNESIRGNTPLKDLLLFLLLLSPSTADELVEKVRLSLSYRRATIMDVLPELTSLKYAHLVEYDDKTMKYKITELGKTVLSTYLDTEDAIYYIPRIQITNNTDRATLLNLIANSPKVRLASKDQPVQSLLSAWIAGLEIVFAPPVFTRNDLLNIKSTAEWQAYSAYKIAKILKKDELANALYKLFLEINYGVPYEYVNLARQIGSKCARQVIGLKIYSKDDLCKDEKVLEMLQSNGCDVKCDKEISTSNQ